MLFFSVPSSAFELKGLQPIQPYGGFSAFNASTPGKGVYSMGIGFERSVDMNYYRATINGGYGISSGTEFLLTIPYLIEWNNSLDGLEDISAGIKQRFFKENKYGPSVAYLLKFSLPTGKNKFTTGGAAGAGLIISKKLGPFSSSLNLIYSVPFDGSYSKQLELIWGLDLRSAHDFDIVAELYAVDSYFTAGFDSVEGRLGYRIRTAENVYTVLGAGYDFKGHDPEFRLTVSFNFIFRKNNNAGDNL
ncbi:hypothetical protein BMS3Abin07_00309 [bacterium BMS3Abin07]|nr:hypothetical protein BMS3Abin07_00309 [bacterium BMS3Abin07]GBE31786.1 hypothetical protein BMS3Bbin05_00689 [bacterium BMS3Bbin05]